MATLTIDLPRRKAITRAHTATHLLHACLIDIFPETRQAGSYVGPDELRFDFLGDRLLTDEELESITLKINTYIEQAKAVRRETMDYEEALKTGAKTFFEEKYPDIVRVVSIDGIEGDAEHYSIELCGGNHLSNTSEIGSFIITEQTTVAAGTRRIVALCGPRVAQYATSLQDATRARASKLGVSTKQLDAKLDRLLGDLTTQTQTIEQLTRGSLQALAWKKKNLGDLEIDAIWNYDHDLKPLGINMKQALEFLKSEHYEQSWLVYSEMGQYALHHNEAKSYITSHKIRGGGSDDFVQGKDQAILQNINTD